jgi:hypothetical protein
VTGSILTSSTRRATTSASRQHRRRWTPGTDDALVDASGDPLPGLADTLDIDDDGDSSELIPDIDLLERITGVVDRGVYERSCRADTDDDVDARDLIDLLVDWGPYSTCPPYKAFDVTRDCEVDTADLIILLAEWGVCPGSSSPQPDTLEDVVACMGLTMEDWEDFEDCMANGTPAEQDNCACWLEHYYEVHCLALCLCSPGCPDGDPWDGHP